MWELVTQAIYLSHLPAAFKEALIHPVPKDQVGESRPITFLSHIGKAGVLMTWRIRQYFTLPSQFGCRLGYSASNAVALAMHWSGRAAHFNKPFAPVFLDMSKAFDRVRHDVLLARLID